ncbi:bifunctional riboflavin kinase/FAD synthetase [Tunicatimonas pelagia]|uniref:bifunctional riboflavin kinase/FAD synthetase n=1 Tax=Tunicatimonas pelagia TaxID=931531 RepID=UPI00266685A4|nr:bifunctional riboflavin kinase/FAD synthetase [Tunicatimonas pelagia]WKN43614.1 bifunctional riboflavin kinase/FAD synthetase [Tunicatimonas pelagia]
MKIHREGKINPPPHQPVVTSGTFDGVHIGHQKILSRLKELAKEVNGETVVLTFWPHPRLILKGDENSLKLLNTFDEKAHLLEQLGIDHLVQIPFTEEFSQLSPDEYVQRILVDQLDTKFLVIGYDHHFGRNRQGNFDYLQQNATRFGFEVEEIPRQDIDDSGVSSTKIRQALETGNVATAHSYLGRHYQISGTVVDGDKIGRGLGFPTANISVEEQYKLIPADGIYAVYVFQEEKRYGGMLYIGNRPTLAGKNKTIEVNIFDFDQDIYGKKLTISFLEHIRGDMTLDSLESLTIQLEKDRAAALAILQSNS